MPNIKILATGGTIAGTGSISTQTTGYQAGVLTPDQLIVAVPVLKNTANISTEQVARIDSCTSNTNAVMVKSAKEVQKELDDPRCDGIVITHGTDTMEETAYFLNLTVHSDKPIIMVGSMRPSTSLPADQISLVLVLMVTSKGIAGVPGVSFVVLLATLGTVGIPVEGLAFISGVDRLLDMARTAVNVVGNSLAAVVISK
ncbi:cation:dicarboxylate symporter family transporter [Peribacillus sp. Hz7]|uniref:cation:dicarboxylate symporter family transporter n=1 Tax=Peribacillus sp. Hz7 TaxID=3344873 RepID=UPI0035C99A1D